MRGYKEWHVLHEEHATDCSAVRVEAILFNLKAPVVTQLLYALPILHDGIHARTSLTVQKLVQLSL